MRNCSKWLESNEKEVYTDAGPLEIKSDLRTASPKKKQDGNKLQPSEYGLILFFSHYRVTGSAFALFRAIC